MKTFAPRIIQKKYFDSSQMILAIVSLSALFATFFISNIALRFETKAAFFSTIVFAYLLICVLFYLRQKQRSDISFFKARSSDSVFNEEIENKLLALEEANHFFGASLKPADMFRLVSSRTGEIIPFTASALFWVDNERSSLKVISATGENAREFLGLEIDASKGLAGKTFQSREIERDENLVLEMGAVPTEALKDLKTAIALPLKNNNGDVFGVFALYGDEEGKFDSDSSNLLEAVGERIAPLLISSSAFERSISNALTDALTNLPNERAFYLILENQIAESQRRREDRPLTVLSVDIKNFARINKKFGHATGDRILAFSAAAIKNQLRKMDFLARGAGDEFLIVLPTASEMMTREIIERLNKTFMLNPFTVEPEKIYIELNFGAATFWQDGETAQELLHTANIRKRQEKTGENSKILWFPKEFVN
jgi:diguanylate cyclase (GGDEF)-like protein